MTSRGKMLIRVIGVACAVTALLGQLGASSGAGPTTQGSQPAATAPDRADFPDAPPGARVTAEGWFAPRVPPRQRHKLPDRVTKAFVVPIREEISGKTFGALRRKVVRVKAAGAELVIFDMDTWGGELGAALDIARMIKVDLARVYTVCYVRTRAVSAGAMIALACDEIIMNPVGTLGDAAPIMRGGKLEGIEREKIETVTRSDFVESARRNGYPEALAECMVSAKREAWLIRHKETGELRYVLAHEWRGRVSSPAGTTTTAPANPDAEWLLVRVVKPEGDLLTLNSDQAIEHGFATKIVAADEHEPYAGVIADLNIARKPEVLADTWSERMVGFLTSEAISALLLFVGVLCLYIELNTPGVGVPGAIALVCFALLFGSRFLIGLAQWWEIAAFVLGALLILLEIFVIPGFGVVGIMGILLTLAALTSMFVANAPDRLPIPDSPLEWSLFTNGMIAFTLALVAAVVAAVVISKHLPQIPVAGRLVLGPAEAAPGTAVPEESVYAAVRAGDEGVVETVCRPVGKVRIGEHLVDAMAEGDVIEAGQRVRVLRRQGNSVVIERA